MRHLLWRQLLLLLLPLVLVLVLQGLSCRTARLCRCRTHALMLHHILVLRHSLMLRLRHLWGDGGALMHG